MPMNDNSIEQLAQDYAFSESEGWPVNLAVLARIKQAYREGFLAGQKSIQQFDWENCYIVKDS